MKKHYVILKNQFLQCAVIGLVAALFPLNQVFAQALTGTKTIPGTYSTLALAVADLNTNGVGTGGVTFNISAGYGEVLTSGLVVTATGTAANPIIFQKSGTGANPEIKAFTGVQLASNSTFIDVMWAFVGSDYVTIDGIDLNEVPANTTATTQMEVGYGFYKASGTDGTNNNTVKNCTITLNRNNTTASTGPRSNAAGSVGIEVMACTPASVGTAITVTAVSGTSSNNKFYSNTIQNVNFGIALGGFAAASPYTLADVNNDIGGTSVATGNNIINFGGGAGATIQCGAVFIHNQWSFNISYNTINNNNGAGVNHPTSNRGIWLYSSSVGAGCDVNNNKITISGGTSTSTINWCIDVEMAQSGANGNTINIKNNQFLNCNVTAATTVGFTAVWLNTAATTVNVSNNNIYGYSYAGTATSQVITHQSGAIGTLNITNNTIDSTVITGATGSFYIIGSLIAATDIFNVRGNNITRTIYNSATSGGKTIYGIFYNSTTPIVNILDNTINDFTRNGTSGGTTIGIYHSGGTNGTSTTTAKRNTISNINIAASAAASTLYGIQLTSGTLICDSNVIFNLSCTGTALMSGIYISSTSNNENYNYNTIYNLTHLGTGNTYAIYTTTNTGVRTISHNTIYAINGAASVSGMYQASSTPSIFSNKIYNLSTSSTTLIVSGITIASITSGTAKVYNNLISGLNASLSNGGATPTVRGIDLTSTAASTTFGIYNNTVYLNATSTGAAFSSTGIYHTYNATATTAALDLRNNIIVNTSTATGTGITAAFRRSAAGVGNFNTTSNNNLLYAGTPSTTNVIYYDGTNADQTLANYQTRMTPREAGSVSEVVNFLNTTGSSPLFLAIDSTIITQIEATGGIIPGIDKDYNDKIRAGNVGYTGNSGLPDLGALEGNYLGSVANQMIYDSANADQFTGIALRGTNNVKVLRVRVHTEKGYNALLATSFALTTSTTTAIADISSAKIYYTASDSTFTNPQLFGSSVPTSAYSITGSVKLVGGANYFWVTYDVKPTATQGNFIDAAVANINVGGSFVSLINGDPTGNLQIKAKLSGNYSVGFSQTYPTITAALDELTQLGVSGPVKFILMDAVYSATSGETFPITLKAYPGSSAVNTVTLVPNSGIVSRIESANTTATIDFNGGSNFIIDGRMGGLGVFVPGNNLVIENTTTTAPAIRFINEAISNKVIYTDLRGANTGAPTVATAGVVNFGTTTGTNGNDSNAISYCDIHAGTAGFPAVGVSTIGSASTLANNDNNRIDNCNIYDFYANTVSSAAVYVGANSGSWVIKKNHIYQTAKRTYTPTALTVHRGLWITPNLADLTTVSGFSIDSNYIGGNLADGTGMYEITSNNNFQFLAIDMSVGKGSLTTVQGNVITNFSDSCATSSSISFGAFNLAGGKINCNGNVIGSRTTNSAITFTTYSGTNGGVMGIRTGAGIAGGAAASTDTINIMNNTIGGITMNGSSTTTAPEFFGVNLSSGAKVNLINNLIGDTTLPNSINIPSTSTTSITVQRVSGVFANSITAGHIYKISNNTIANITNAYESATTALSATRGIFVGPSVTGTDSVMGNLVKNISTASRVKNGGISSALGGIVVDATASTSQVVTRNTVHSLTLTNLSVIDTMNVAGIIFNVNTTGSNVVNGNTVHSLSMAAYNPYVIMTGLNLVAGNAAVTNNMIGLGFDNTGSNIIAACSIRGILKNTGSTNIYFNTVRIGGAGVGMDPNRTISFQRNGAGTDDVRNNIFINTRNSGGVGGGHLAIVLNNTTTLTQNNNIYKADSFGVSNGTGYLTFANWQTASPALDINSKDTVVNFASVNNLHLASNMNGRHTFDGAVIAGITQDIDGNNRYTPPYIGADEVATHPLPVEFLGIAAVVKGDDVLVSWTTASEQNNRGFEVERSVDGKTFEYVNFVKGAGNSNMVESYQLTDAKAFTQMNVQSLYYRVKQVDMDGQFSYSNTVNVSQTTRQLQAVSVYPNPVVGVPTVSISTTFSGNAGIEISDIQGRIISEENISVQTGLNMIPVSKLNSVNTGIYFVKITINGESQVVKVVKQ